MELQHCDGPSCPCKNKQYILELEAENQRLREALEIISRALDAYGVDYCREAAKAALEGE